MSIIIRHESPEDFRMVEHITREAFWNLYKPGCDEHYLVHKLRNHSDYIPDLSFVIEKDNEIVGSIFYTESKVINDSGKEFKTLTFGPVSIVPKYHRQGLGRALISYSIEKAAASNYPAIIIGGFPYHYKCFGFVGAKKYGISLPDGNFYTGIMALPLYDGALDNISGSVYFSDCLEGNEWEAETFDGSFSFKEKRVLPCQKEFERAAAERDDFLY